jgi:hypothetical protein
MHWLLTDSLRNLDNSTEFTQRLSAGADRTMNAKQLAEHSTHQYFEERILPEVDVWLE